MHAIGLISDGGVHSGWEHIEAVIELAAEEGVSDLVVHALTDGRDTLPTSGRRLRRRARALAQARRAASGPSAAATGAWTATAAGSAPRRPTTRSSGRRASAPTPRCAAIQASYEADVTDEFIEPTVIGDYDGVAADEPVLFINFRPDRARQLTLALGEPAFDDFDREGGPVLEVTTMTEYKDGWPYPVAFPPSAPETTIAEVIAEQGGRQLHVAETEKYAHVTYFFNGGREQEWGGEERALVALAARRRDLRPQARDERRRGRRASSPPTGARSRRPDSASASSTSPTPTWSATPA